mgnify:CR=1 FL=1
MNTKLLFLPIIGATTFFVLLFSFTKIFGPIPFSVNSVVTTKSTTFDVTGEGKVSAIPDIALINVGVFSQAPTVKQAQNLLNKNINQVSDAIKNLGIDKKDIQTSNYNITPSYDFSGSSQKITGYLASSNLSIKVRQIDKANSVIDEATANGANQVGGINFDIDDKTKLEDEAREKAVAAARKKAETAAKIAGFRLGRIVNYSESQLGFLRAVPMMALADTKSQGAPTEVEPGSTDITVSITLSYEIQ